MSELKVCPFCRGNSFSSRAKQWFVECKKCGATGPERPTEAEAIAAWNSRAPSVTFQDRVAPWMQACFGPEISADRVERGDRFIEEALELAQSIGMPKSRVLALVDYVFSRDIGDTPQEVGGVLVTLAALCLAFGLDMHEAGETELARIWTKVDVIRAKQAAKPKGSALPVAVESRAPTVTREDVARGLWERQSDIPWGSDPERMEWLYDETRKTADAILALIGGALSVTREDVEEAVAKGAADGIKIDAFRGKVSMDFSKITDAILAMIGGTP